MPLLRRPMFLFLVLVAAACWASVGAVAKGRGESGDKGGQKRQVRAEPASLSEAVRRIERATQGQILSAERVHFDGREINRVKVLDDRGRVRIYVYDPEKSVKSSDDKPSRRTHRDDKDDPNL